MEDVLEVYTRPLDPARPLVCLDEASKELHSEKRPAQPVGPGRVARQDYEYVRQGTANLFLWVAPLVGRRGVDVTSTRTGLEMAEQVRRLVDEVFPDAEIIVLVTDNLNTHGPWVLYEAFPPEEARRIAAKVEWHYTPEHGSWLNMAEIEISVLRGQCLDRRIPDITTLMRTVAAWERARNDAEVVIEWHFTTAAARIKLKHLYPVVRPKGASLSSATVQD